MKELTFEQINWLFLIALVPLCVVAAALVSRLRRKQWSAFVSPRLRPRLLRGASPAGRWVALGFLQLAFVLLAFVLARPQTKEGASVEKSRGRNMLISLDLSRSMLTKDLKPDRLTQAKTLCNELIDAAPNDRIGLVTFAGEAVLSAPLTVDHEAIRESIDQADIDTIPVQGSNLNGALKLCIETLKKTGQKENALVFLTDGEETTQKMKEVAAEAKKAGIYIFAVAFGTEEGDYIPDPQSRDGRHLDKSGKPVRSRLSTESLIALTTATGGRTVVATSATDIPAMVSTAMQGMEQFDLDGASRVVPEEHYQWFLLPAIISMIASVLAATRWRSAAARTVRTAAPATAAAAAVLLMLSPAPARAYEGETQALNLLKGGKNKEAADAYDKLAKSIAPAQDAYRFRLAQGTACFQGGDISGARAAFSEALLSADPKVKAAAHHGLGNVLFQSGWRSLSDDLPYPETEKPQLDALGGDFDQTLDMLLGRNAPGANEHDSNDPMAPFDKMVGKHIGEWLAEETSDGTRTKGYELFDGVLNDWFDAARHYDSAVKYDPGLQNSRDNRALDVKYLKRLIDIMDQVEQSAKMMEGGQGEGDDEGKNPGNGDGGEKDGQGSGNGRRHRHSKKGDQGEEKGKGDDGKEKNDKGGGDEKGKDGNKPRNGESAEDAAKRILKENADFEKAGGGRTHLEYQQPDRDW